MMQRFNNRGLRWFRAAFRATALLLALGAMGSCALFSPGDEEVYILVRAHGEPVPATVLRLESPQGDSWRELRILRGRLSLSADGRWTQQETTETVIDGVASRSSWRMTGRYERTGDDLVLYYSGPEYNPGDRRSAEIRVIGHRRTLTVYSLFREEFELAR